uniref:Uncharacterized protein n=1 Tax=Rhizobium leguminosarum TaxID=384 RepID=A0A154INX0_RHILE|nr:hypothetical protein A4A59_36705 [Rhizobium leguminosarum]
MLNIKLFTFKIIFINSKQYMEMRIICIIIRVMIVSFHATRIIICFSLFINVIHIFRDKSFFIIRHF